MDPHPNLAYTTITTPPSPALSGTSLIVAAGTGARFGWTGSAFNATVWPAGQRPVPSNAEIVRVTNIVGDTLTLDRAEEGSVARAIIASDQIAATVTDKVLSDIEDRTYITVSAETQLSGSRRLIAGPNITLDTTTPGEIEIDSVGGGGGNVTDTGADGAEPVGAVDGDLYFPNNGLHLERFNGTIWPPWGPIWPMIRPVDADFVWINQGGATITQTNGGLYLVAPALAGVSVRIRKKAAPVTPYTVTVGLVFNWQIISTDTQLGGLIFRNAASGAFQSFWFGRTAAGIGWKISKWTNPTTFSAHYIDGVSDIRPTGLLWLRIADNGTNRICSISYDGHNFITLHTIGRTDFLTADEVGFALSEQSGVIAIGMMIVSWRQG